MKSFDAVAQHGDELVELASQAHFTVFLCGPKLGSKEPSAVLRQHIKDILEEADFEVVLGEDEGLLDPRIKRAGFNAQDNELEFIRKRCNAVVIVANSVGSFCELGLFSWHFVHEDGVLDSGTDFIVLINQKYEADPSYLNEGPAFAVHGFGQVEYVDFANYSGQSILRRLSSRRGVFALDKRGRTRK